MGKLNFGKSIKKETVFEIAYKELKSAILGNELDYSEYYTESDFAKVLGISRTPVREAVQALIHDRLLEAVPRKGLKMRSFSESEVNQIFLLRKAIEKEVLVIFMKAVTEEQIVTLKKILSDQKETVRNQNKRSFIQLDQKFHMQIIHDTNYDLVKEFFMILHDLTVLIGHQAIRKEGRMNEVIAEHETIIRMMEKRDVDGVTNKMLIHLDNTMKSYHSMDSNKS